MMRIWKLLIELLVEPGDAPSGLTKGFMNVTTWADSAEAAAGKVGKYLAQFNWHVPSVEEAHPIADGEDYGEVLEEMIERTRTDRDAIVLGTFHGYKET